MYNEAFVILQEECAEVIQELSKCMRFGVDDEYNGQTNRLKLENELGDVVALIDILQKMDIVSFTNIEKQAERKKNKLKQWSNLKEYL